MNLITIDDIKLFKPISINTDIAKFLTPYIQEAQEFDLKEILGVPFYLDLVENITEPDYADLFNGKSYTWNGRNYEHLGIKPCLIYLTYARFLQNSNQSVTAYGVVHKQNDYSEKVSEATMNRIINQAMAGAKSYEISFKEYLNRFPNEFPIYENCCSQNSGSKKIFKISKIKKW